MTTFYNDYVPLLVAVDCIVFGFEEGQLRLLIGKRKMDPGRGQWSLYGGFVRENESLDAAATRTLEKLTGLTDIYMQQVGAFGRVDRDPGERVISVAYYALINVADYDRNLLRKHEVEWVDIKQLPLLYGDHRDMVFMALARMRRQIRIEPIGFSLLPELFTLTQLQTLYEAVMGEELDKRNFRKKVKELDFIEKTDQIDKLSSKRGAALYRFNKNLYNEDPNFKL
ncbi:MAG: NUDIX hydrolase [Prevotella sp.]|nr:NUDIX hydrolase [Prevotella sp.]